MSKEVYEYDSFNKILEQVENNARFKDIEDRILVLRDEQSKMKPAKPIEEEKQVHQKKAFKK